MSTQIEVKKKIINKAKKQPHKSVQIPQNNKKLIKVSDHGQKTDSNINSNNNYIINNQNNSKNIHKLQEELNIYKNKSQKLEEEIIKLNFKIKEMSERNAKKNEEEKNSEEDNSSFSSQKKNPLKKAISSAYDILIEIVELLLNQKNYKDKDKENNLTPKQIENISMDIYEPSVYNDDERRALLFEQIQQILIFKINYVNKMYHLGLEKQCERIKNWNINAMNTTKDNNKDISFLSFSAFSNNKKRSPNVSMNNSDIGLGIIPNHSPKFPERKDSYSAISNIMDESTIKDLSNSIINYNNNAPHFGLGGDSFFFENENLSKSKEDIENKEQSKGKEVNLINTSFKDLSLIRSGDEQNVSFTKNLDKYTPNTEGGINEINSGKIQNKEIFIKNENQFDISFNDI